MAYVRPFRCVVVCCEQMFVWVVLECLPDVFHERPLLIPTQCGEKKLVEESHELELLMTYHKDHHKGSTCDSLRGLLGTEGSSHAG